MGRVVVTHPCKVCADLQLRQRLPDVAAQLSSGGVRLLVVTAGVTEGAVDAGPDQAQVEAEFPSSLLEDLQPHAGILQSLLGFSHGWIKDTTDNSHTTIFPTDNNRISYNVNII